MKPMFLAPLALLLAGAAAAAPLPPVCSAGALQPARLQAGERLVYKLDVLGAEIGSLELSVLRAPPADRKKGPTLVEARGKSSDLISTNVQHIEGWSEVLVGTAGQPVRYREEVDEGKLHRSQVIDFPSLTGNLSIRATKNGEQDRIELAATPDARDLLSALFVLRQQPLRPGAVFCSEVYAARRMWRVLGTAAKAPEQIDTALGKLDTLRIDAVATRIDDPTIVRKAHVWITRDDRRLPVVILGEVRGRYLRAQLTEAKQNRRAEARR